jgi:3-oxoacyl-[acyl-carrier protein] reductase
MTNSVKKSAVITGASGGIGGEVAKRLVRDGFRVVIHYAGKPAPAQALVAELKATRDFTVQSNSAA